MCPTRGQRGRGGQGEVQGWRFCLWSCLGQLSRKGIEQRGIYKRQRDDWVEGFEIPPDSPVFKPLHRGKTLRDSVTHKVGHTQTHIYMRNINVRPQDTKLLLHIISIVYYNSKIKICRLFSHNSWTLHLWGRKQWVSVHRIWLNSEVYFNFLWGKAKLCLLL